MSFFHINEDPSYDENGSLPDTEWDDTEMLIDFDVTVKLAEPYSPYVTVNS